MRSAVRLIAAIATAVLLVYAASLLALRAMGYELSVVMSDSMLPTAARGDLVLSRSEEPVKRGDVVLFDRAGVVVLHRLVAQTPAGWRTKGDANHQRDPWVVADSAIKGKATGVLHALGVPMLWFEGALHRGVRASFGSGAQVQNQASSALWQSVTMNWTMYANVSFIQTSQPSTVNFVGSGERRLYNSFNKLPTEVHMHLDGYLTKSDATAAGYALVANGCISGGDQVTCGWLVRFNDTSRTVTLQTILTNTTRSPVLASCPLPSDVNGTASHTLAFQRSGKSIYVAINGLPCIHVVDAPALAQSVNAKIPSGTMCVFMVSGQNQLFANRAVTW